MIYLGMFRAIFQIQTTSLFKLACQLWSGASTFDFTNPGDATVKSTDNNLCSYAPATYPGYGTTRSKVHTVTWVNDLGTKGLAISTNNYAGILAGLIEPTITYYPFYNMKRVIQGGKKYIANPNDTTWEVGGIHIEDRAGTDYIVAYLLKEVNSTTVRLEKYSIIYDESILQENIVLFAESGFNTPDYSGDFDAGVLVGVPTKIDQGAEDTKFIVAQNRQLCCNRAGTKVIFFIEERPIYDEWLILEATDNGSSIIITQHSKFVEPKTATIRTDTKTISGSQFMSASSTGGTEFETSSTTTGSGSIVDHTTQASNARSTLLGVAYSKYDDSILILTRDDDEFYFIRDKTQNFNIDHSCSDTVYPGGFSQLFVPASQSLTDIVNRTWTIHDRRDYPNVSAIKINGVSIAASLENFNEYIATTTWNGYKTNIYTYVYTKNSTSSYNMQVSTLSNLKVIDLSAKLFVYEAAIRSESGNYNGDPGTLYPEHKATYTGFDGTKIIVNANGIETVVKDDTAPISGVNHEVCFRPYGPMVCNPSCSFPVETTAYNYSASEIYDSETMEFAT